MEPSSVMPSARSGHGSSPVLGDTFFVFGGINDSGYLGDLFMFNIVSNEWIELSADVLPPARSNACMTFMYPFLVIHGGENGSGYLSDLWVFDYEYSYFLEISVDGKVPALKEHVCILDGNYKLYIFGGRLTPFQLNTYIYMSLALESWLEPTPAPPSLIFSNAGLVLMQEAFAIIGGSQLTNSLSNVTLYSTTTGTGFSLDTLPVTVTSHAVSHAGRSIYVFGGTLTMGQTYFDEVGTSNFYKITHSSFDCSRGFFGDSCTMCLPGSLGGSLNSALCELCGAGTYSSSYGLGYTAQCTPCPSGSYAESPGSSLCRSCNNPNDCSIGSRAEDSVMIYNSFEELQPLAYDEGTTAAKARVEYYEFAALGMMGLVWALYLCVNKREGFAKVDIFDNKHERKYYEEPFKNAFGGVVSVAFFLAASIFIVSPIIVYNMANIAEIKTFLPIFTLQNTTFASDIVYISISMYNYGGQCGNTNSTCIGHIDTSIYGMTGDISDFYCEREESTCMIYMVCANCTVDLVSGVYITVWESLAYTTGFQVVIETTSSIPDSNTSALLYYVNSPQGKVFNGLNPTVFTLSIIPSVRQT